MIRLLNKGPAFSIVAMALLAGGCASTDDVKHAQDTADQALAAAQAAQRSSDQNRTDINTLQQNVQTLQQNVQQLQAAPPKRHGERG